MPDLRESLELGWLDIAWLFVDTEVQREKLDERRVATIVKEFDPLKFEALRVNRRTPIKYAVIEGGHRLAAAEELKIQFLPCLISQQLEIPVEAQTFLGIARGRKAVRLSDQHRVGARGGDQEAIAIDKILAGFGLRVAGHKNATTICSIRALQKAYRRGNLEATLGVLLRAWPNESVATDGEIIDGVSAFIGAFPSMHEKRLVAVLGSASAPAFQRMARVLAGELATKPWRGVAFHALALYNRKREVGNKLARERLVEYMATRLKSNA